MQKDLDNLIKWCKCNCMTFNISKCFSMSISKSREPICSVYNINGHSLVSVDQMCDLGVIFDTKLSFVQHIDYIIPKAFAALALIKRHAKLFNDIGVLNVLFSSFVRSKLEYASVLWNPIAEVHSSRLERVQRIFSKFALRKLFVANNSLPSYDSRRLLLGLKSLKTRREIASLLFVYDVINSNIDCIGLLESIKFAVPVRSLRSIDTFRLAHSSLTYREPISRALEMYNKLLRTYQLDFSMSRTCFVKRLNEIL